MKNYQVKAEANEAEFKIITAPSPRAARRQYRKANGLHPKTEVVCKEVPQQSVDEAK